MFAVTMLALAMPPAPSSHCYLMLFAGQAAVWQPKSAHTWATFVRSQNDGSNLDLVHFTISWLPTELPVKPFGAPTTGRNYGLHETIDLYHNAVEPVHFWGPFEIGSDWFDSAKQYKSSLDSGLVKYVVFDRGPWFHDAPIRRPDLAHCVHAFTRTNGLLDSAAVPVYWYGTHITRRVANRLDDLGLITDPGYTHDWLIDAFDLRKYKFKRHDLNESAFRWKSLSRRDP
jgi:hypothetical protein